MLGNWTDNIPHLAATFSGAKPFDHVVIDNFLSDDIACALDAEFPTPPPGSDIAPWVRYHNPIEKKFALNRLDGLPMMQRVFDMLQSPFFVHLVSRISGISELENDPHLHGAGLHYHPRGGKLDMHLDYSKHPLSGKERRLNLILYINEGWEETWGGHLELWDGSFTSCVARVSPVFNRAVLFRTSDISYHGLPQPLTCPESAGRKSLAIYYVSPSREGAAQRHKAEFRALPHQPTDTRLLRLYDIRKTGTLAEADLRAIWPTWEGDGGGFW